MLGDFFNGKKAEALDEQIEAVLNEMREVGVTSEEYPTLMRYLEQLNEIKAKQRRDPVSRDTIALIVGGMIEVLIIVAYEQKNVLTSKALGLVIRPKRPN